MKPRILFKMVGSSLKKNKRTILPYMVAGIFTVMFFYILRSLSNCPYLYDHFTHQEAFYGAQYIAIIMEMGSTVVAVFSAIFLLYANRFVMKNRRRELGLYGVLGLTKWNVSCIIFTETLLVAVIAIAGGLLFGTFLNKLMLLILYKIIKMPPVSGLFISKEAVSFTLGWFLPIYLIILIYNIASIRLVNPITLLHSDVIGEKEPKVKWPLFVFGVLFIGAGYYLAQSCRSTSEVFLLLFPAIICVIIGTYFLFTAGTIAFLKALKKNKKIYYKSKNFISISALLYRMKHNAAGLASICVMASGVMVLMSCCVSLAMTGQDTINRIYPRDVLIHGAQSNNLPEGMDDVSLYRQVVHEAAEECGFTIKTDIYRKYITSVWTKTETGYIPLPYGELYDMTSSEDVYMLTLDDYRENIDSAVELAAGQVLFYSTRGRSPEQVNILGHSFEVAGSPDLKVFRDLENSTLSLLDKLYVVFPNEEEMMSVLADDVRDEYERNGYSVYAGFDVGRLTQEQMQAANDVLVNKFRLAGVEPRVKFKQDDSMFFTDIYGGCFFVGIFLSVMFLLATTMIIYYKQISEGYEDRKRFEILQKVGMTGQEIRKVINGQVLLLFFLPVVTAIVHMCVAAKIIILFLKSILFVDRGVFVLGLAIVCVVFLLVYWLVYRFTNNQYLKIVYTEG